MSLRETRYEIPNTFRPSPSEIEILWNLDQESRSHESGGSYNMLAQWRKGSRVATGRNRRNRRASTMSDDYPETCGIHAELALYHLVKPRGGIVYVAGTRTSETSKMPTTVPCIYCMALLEGCKIRAVVFYLNGDPVKMQF